MTENVRLAPVDPAESAHEVPTPPLTLRLLEAGDLSALAEVFYAAVHAISDELYDAAERERWAPTPLDPERLRARLEAAQTVVALEHGRIVGFMSMDQDGVIDMAYVHPDHQRRGVASALLNRLQAHAEVLRLGCLFAEVSHAARPFFERSGFTVVRPNEVQRGGGSLGNWRMERRLVPLEGRGRLFVIGNSGAGKTTLARSLAEQLGRSCVDLDEVAFADQVGTRRPVEASIDMLSAQEGLDAAVIEGCYADLMEEMATPDDHLIWLDLPIEDCVANAQQRPWEPHKWPSAELQNAFLPTLIGFIRTYETSAEPTGRPAHRRLFSTFAGTRERHVERLSLTR